MPSEHQARMALFSQVHKAKSALQAARQAWQETGRPWQPMEDCPFEALMGLTGYEARIAVTDGKRTTVATVWPRLDGRKLKGAPDWWHQWELRDDLEPCWQADLEDGIIVNEPVAFIPTQWTFLPEV